MAHANQYQEATTYFNLHTVGIGYLNRVREVQVRRGQPFMACDIAALHGATDAVEYTRFDCKVAGGEAERLIRLYMDAVKAEKKVLLSFRIDDLWIDPFLYEKGDKQGQPGASLILGFRSPPLRHQPTLGMERIAGIYRGLVRLMPISADFDPETGWGIKAFSPLPCDGCGG